ncbi:MAG: hypothetical protein PWQ17_689 [Anaerophaga sp.]|uniref:YIP1 family protein n=1 Tax=Anaerophaga thermohalophila TaxID=177400 RepID=UPI000237CA99|nr:Yip1 family protein [Anaerophaga thermohalophila]MDI3521749.1 hypothetical protein [Anaerophaga sp.]MDK2841184.1 hypothetical protein [Anaerophaga sp.]MDN5291766.1 hypothetical protein [Anaerophaga sp.]
MGAKESVNTVHMYRQLWLRLRNLITAPLKEWQKIHRESVTFNDLLSTFALPLIGLVAVATFISYLINQQAFLIELALKKVIVEFTALFSGLFLAWDFVFRIMKYFRFVPSREIAAKLTVYSSAPLYLVLLLTALVPEIFFLQVFAFYSIYLVLTGIRIIAGPEQKQKTVFSVLTGLLILGLPYVIRILLLNLITI